MKTARVAFAFSVALSLSASLVHAQNVSATLTSYSKLISMDLKVPGVGVQNGESAAQLSFTDAANKSFSAFCVELAQPVSLNGKYTYAVGSFAAGVSTNLQNLFSSSFSKVSTDADRGAFQLAVWKLTHETDTKNLYSLQAGNFQLLTTSSNYQSLNTVANGFLAAAKSYTGPSLFLLDNLTNPTAQDVVRFSKLTSPVPEPTSYAMFAAGLGTVLWVARRRRVRQA